MGVLERERERLVAPAAGAVLELRGGRVGAYPPAVTSVVAGRVPGLPYADGSFDTIVCAFGLCSVPDVAGGLADLRRVLRPEGSLLFLEHNIGRNPVTAAIQRAVAPAWRCRLDQDAIALLRGGGFVVADCERLAPLGRVSAGTLVRGRAIKRRGT